MISREEVLTACQEGADRVWAIIAHLQQQLAEKGRHIQALEEEIRLLKHRLGQHSQNSHNPPSADRFVKPRSLRRPSTRPAGGQPGHPGHTLRLVPQTDVDERMIHPAPHQCTRCGQALADQPIANEERRQVFDLPPLRLQVTEHRLPAKQCPACGQLNRAPSPAGVEQPAQYGPQVLALAVYLHVHQLIPFDRLRQLFADLFGQSISTGTLTAMLDHGAERLQPFQRALHEQLQAEPVPHHDETGIRIDAANHWLHVSSNDRLTCFSVDPRRGRLALDAEGILPGYASTVVHDCLAAYFTYSDCTHALCNAHIQRELRAAGELTGQSWPAELETLLEEARQAVESARQAGHTCLTPQARAAFHARYHAILAQARVLHPVFFKETPPKRGRDKKTKVQNLLERLTKHDLAVLRFLDDFRVPFTNNQAERDLRMAKVKQKISGGFRTDDGAERFYRIRSYTSTAQKHCLTILDALQRLFRGHAFLPARGP